MVNACKLTSVVAGSLLVANLCGGWLYMVFSHSPLLFWSWCCVNAAPAIKTRTVNIVYNYGTVYISVMYNVNIYAAYRGVIPKMAAIPTATAITETAVAITVVYAPVKAYVRTPITGVKAIKTAFKAPVSGCP